MNRLQNAWKRDKLQLFVSLPSNDEQLAKAAIEEGADGVKVHMNVSHRASGNSFGPLAAYRETFEHIRGMFDGPLGIVPGGSLQDIHPEEIEALPDIGFDFFSIYAFHMPIFLLRFPKLARTFAINSEFDLRLIEAAGPFRIDALEASVIPGEEYGSPLSFADLLKYRWLVQHSGLPVIVPSQRKIVPDDVPSLVDCGVKALLIGAVVTGNQADEVRRAVAGFREAIDR
ncbi:hypothetical protein [Paenibacillus tyrfis]|uniref:Thiamine phosphate synthase/TenI domain-containing protein n=1 Tax=Paenibacillus tyrfis TaxID=1501230 RepID=A0A081P234_9BACL|nr:hypothetical protein [Paenibacillus tyrfis]KEQ24757.1 hypothetical protein ET33_06670 [Paenibacillus tyrfis]